MSIEAPLGFDEEYSEEMARLLALARSGEVAEAGILPAPIEVQNSILYDGIIWVLTSVQQDIDEHRERKALRERLYPGLTRRERLIFYLTYLHSDLHMLDRVIEGELAFGPPPEPTSLQDYKDLGKELFYGIRNKIKGRKT